MSEITTFDPAVVEAVCGHMNGDHTDDSLLIVKALGGIEDATDARMVGFDSAGADFVATRDGDEHAVHVPFASPAHDRMAIRHAIVQQYQDACAAAGIEPRAAE
jgi:putative heme iron utilization protein